MACCPICKSYVLSLSSHKCPPKWLCWDDDMIKEEEAGHIIHSNYSEEAAAAFVEAMDDNSSMEYTTQGRNEKRVVVEPFEGGTRMTFIVYPEARFHYLALKEKIDDDNES